MDHWVACFSICGRFLLGLLLRANLLARDVVLSRDGNGDTKLDLSSSQNTGDPTDPSLAATQAMSEAATKRLWWRQKPNLNNEFLFSQIIPPRAKYCKMQEAADRYKMAMQRKRLVKSG